MPFGSRDKVSACAPSLSSLFSLLSFLFSLFSFLFSLLSSLFSLFSFLFSLFSFLFSLFSLFSFFSFLFLFLLEARGGACEGAIDACGGAGGAVAGTTVGLPDVIGDDGGGDAFYYFELRGPLASVTFDSCGSAFDTFLRVLQLRPRGVHNDGELDADDDNAEWGEVAGCDDCGDCGTQNDPRDGPFLAVTREW